MGVLVWLESLPLSVWVHESPSVWAQPTVLTLHTMGMAVLVGASWVLDLRLLGLRRSVPVRRLAGRMLPWTAASFFLIVPSGLAMFVANAGELIANPVFAVKICLILLAGANAGIFHAGVFRRAAQWDVDVMPPIAARAAAAASLALWVSVIACGRSLAHV